MHLLNVVAPLLVPIMTGIVGAVGLMLKDRRLARDSRNTRHQAFCAATAEVGFANDWWKAQQLLGPDAAAEARPKMMVWLAEAEAMVSSAQHLPVRHNRVTVRRLFLLEPAHRRSSKVLKALFWISVLWLAVGAIVTATDIDQRHQHSYVSGDIGLVIFSAVLVLLLHLWAEHSEESAAAAFAGGHAPALAGSAAQTWTTSSPTH